MDTTGTKREFAVLKKEHASLTHEVEDWRKWWQELRELGAPHFGEMGDRLAQLRQHLAAHFAHEERQQALDIMLKLPPEKVQLMAQLRDEHNFLLESLGKIVERLQGCSPEIDCWGKAREEFEVFLDRLNAHEDAEEELFNTLP